MTATPSSVEGDRSDLLRALEFAERQFKQWHQSGLIRADQYEGLRRYHEGLRQAVQGGDVPAGLGVRPADRCWSCRGPLEPGDKACDQCGAPANTLEVRAL